PTTNPAMEDDIAGSLLELVEILMPMLKARSSSFISKYLPRPLAPGAYVLSLEDNPAEWLKPASSTQITFTRTDICAPCRGAPFLRVLPEGRRGLLRLSAMISGNKAH